MTTDARSRGFDPDALRAKYRAERDKRLRADANDQYVEMAGQFARYREDPYCEPVERTPLSDDVDVVVIGGGSPAFFSLIRAWRETGKLEGLELR